MFTIKEILGSTGGRLIQGNVNSRTAGVSIDSRTIKPGELFIAIKGRNFDGHNFIYQAQSQGAGAILFSHNRHKSFASVCQRWQQIPMVKVKNTVQALGNLAHFHRARFNIPVIAVTGSNGKTTTKEMLSNIFAASFHVLGNIGTQNNHIGVPLTILKLGAKYNLAVIEIGANHAGEIDRLSWIVQPTVGVITNIGPAHLEFFKSLKGVCAAKLELIKNLAKNGKIILNKDDQFLSQLNGANPKKVTFGFNRLANFYGEIIKQTEKSTTFVLNRKQRIIIKALGRHNVYNALASIAVARCFGISYSKIKKALAVFKPPPMRMQMLNINQIKIINDCYNSNPGSFGCVLDFLGEHSSKGKKIVVCGDMLELGEKAEKLHLDIGKKIAKTKVDFLITVGPLSRNIACGAQLAGMPQNLIRTCCTTQEAGKFLRVLTSVGDFILIKGSRSIQMENILKCFTSSSTH